MLYFSLIINPSIVIKSAYKDFIIIQYNLNSALKLIYRKRGLLCTREGNFTPNWEKDLNFCGKRLKQLREVLSVLADRGHFGLHFYMLFKIFTPFVWQH